MALDPAWIGVIGTAIGAAAPSLGAAVKSAIDGRAVNAKLKHDAAEAKLQREADAAEAEAQRVFEEKARRREFAANLLPERRAKIAYWQEQLFAAGEAHRQFVGYEHARPNAVGQRWFDDLCTHLTGQAAEDYGNVAIVRINGDAISDLSAEIARIEREWIAEAQG